MAKQLGKPKAPAKPKASPPEPSSYSTAQLDIIKEENKKWSDKVKNADDLQTIEDIARRICGDAKYVKDGIIFPCGKRKGLSRYCVPPENGRTNSPLRTSQETIDAVNKRQEPISTGTGSRQKRVVNICRPMCLGLSNLPLMKM